MALLIFSHCVAGKRWLGSVGPSQRCAPGRATTPGETHPCSLGCSPGLIGLTGSGHQGRLGGTEAGLTISPNGFASSGWSTVRARGLRPYLGDAPRATLRKTHSCGGAMPPVLLGWGKAGAVCPPDGTTRPGCTEASSSSALNGCLPCWGPNQVETLEQPDQAEAAWLSAGGLGVAAHARSQLDQAVGAASVVAHVGSWDIVLDAPVLGERQTRPCLRRALVAQSRCRRP